jgi:mRNA interferase MazF
MRHGVTFKTFDVVSVPFPFTDREASKRRPALIISSARFNQHHNQVILSMITSTTENLWHSDVPITNWQFAGLKVACRVRLKIFTLDQSLVVKVIGHLSPKDIKTAKAALADYIVTA